MIQERTNAKHSQPEQLTADSIFIKNTVHLKAEKTWHLESIVKVSQVNKEKSVYHAFGRIRYNSLYFKFSSLVSYQNQKQTSIIFKTALLPLF